MILGGIIYAKYCDYRSNLKANILKLLDGKSLFLLFIGQGDFHNKLLYTI